LKDSIKKFETRFRNMEKTVAESGSTLDSASRNELDMLWEEVKRREAEGGRRKAKD